MGVRAGGNDTGLLRGLLFFSGENAFYAYRWQTCGYVGLQSGRSDYPPKTPEVERSPVTTPLTTQHRQTRRFNPLAGDIFLQQLCNSSHNRHINALEGKRDGPRRVNSKPPTPQDRSTRDPGQGGFPERAEGVNNNRHQFCRGDISEEMLIALNPSAADKTWRRHQVREQLQRQMNPAVDTL